MKRLLAVFALALAVVLLAFPGAAMAQEYPNVGDNDDQVLDRDITRPVAAPDVVTQPAQAAPLPSGLAVTGGDIIGLTAIGAACIAFGVVLRRRAQPVHA